MVCVLLSLGIAAPLLAEPEKCELDDPSSFPTHVPSFLLKGWWVNNSMVAVLPDREIRCHSIPVSFENFFMFPEGSYVVRSMCDSMKVYRQANLQMTREYYAYFYVKFEELMYRCK